MMKNLIRVMMVLLSVGIAVRIKKRMFYRYLPVGLFSTILSFIRLFYMHHRGKLNFAGGAREAFCTLLLAAFGPHLWFTLFTFDKSKGKLVNYTLLTTLLNTFYIFLIVNFMKKLRFVRLNLSLNTLFVITMLHSYLNFFFQHFYERRLGRRPSVNK